MDWGILFAVLVGGVMTLLGTLLANYLEYRAERRERRRERLEQRLDEVRHYVMRILRGVDLLCDATEEVAAGLAAGSTAATVLRRRAQKYLESEEYYHPVGGSAAAFFVHDDDLRDLLVKIDRVWSGVHEAWQGSLRNEDVEEDIPALRDELAKLAETVSKRMDWLVETI